MAVGVQASDYIERYQLNLEVSEHELLVSTCLKRTIVHNVNVPVPLTGRLPGEKGDGPPAKASSQARQKSPCRLSAWTPFAGRLRWFGPFGERLIFDVGGVRLIFFRTACWSGRGRERGGSCLSDLLSTQHPRCIHCGLGRIKSVTCVPCGQQIGS